MIFDLTDTSKPSYQHNLFDIAKEFSDKGLFYAATSMRKLVAWVYAVRDPQFAMSSCLPFRITSVDLVTGVIQTDEAYTSGAVVFALMMALEQHRSTYITAPYKSFDDLLEHYFKRSYDSEFSRLDGRDRC